VTPHQGQGKAEARALAGLTPSLKSALMKARVFNADRQAQTRSAGTSNPGRVGSPEPAEYQLLFSGSQTHTEIPNRDRNGVFVGTHSDLNWFPLGMIDCIGNQVPQDSLDATCVDLRDDLVFRHLDEQLDARLVGQMAHIAQRTFDGRPQIDRLDRKLRYTRIVSGDLQ
jgi:hypothetical protein